MITWHANHESSCTQINEHDAAKWTAGAHHVVNRCTIAVRVGAAEAAQGGAACDRATASGLSEDAASSCVERSRGERAIGAPVVSARYRCSKSSL